MRNIIKNLKLYLCLSLVVISSLYPLKVFAKADIDFFSTNDILFYNPDEVACSNSATTSSGTGKDTGKWQTQLQGPYSFEDYVVEILRNIAKKMDAPEEDVVTEEHVIALIAFGWGEGGNLMNRWLFNVFNTGYRSSDIAMSSATKTNGTQGYASFNDGVEATARTMTGKNQNRLANTLIKKDSTAKEFMYALTYYKKYSGNKLWAEASVANPDKYYQERLNLISTAKRNYKKIASTQLGEPGNNYRKNLHVDYSKLRYSFGDSSTGSGGSSGGGGSMSDKCSNDSGDIGSANGFTFPLKSTKAAIKKGVDGTAWCWNKETNCHHDYKAADIFAETGTPILAAKGGKVVAGSKPGCSSNSLGCNVQIMGEDKVLYYYTHMSKPSTVKKGQSVDAGDQIGEVGTNKTAAGTPRHLHIDMLPGDQYSGRVACAGSACSGYPFINVQKYLYDAFKDLAEG